MVKKQHIETIAVHGAHNISSSESDIIQPIHLSTTFERKPDGTLNDYVYGLCGPCTLRTASVHHDGGPPSPEVTGAFCRVP